MVTPASSQELSSQLPFALLQRIVCLKTCLPTLCLILTTKIYLHRGGTTTFVIPLPRASNGKAQGFLGGENQASNSRQGHGVITISLCPQKSSRAISSRSLWQSSESSCTIPNCKMNRKLISMQQKPPLRSTWISGSQLNFPLQMMMMHFLIPCTFPRMLLLGSTTGCKRGTQ